MSHTAVLRTCQIPFTLGLPSAVRGVADDADGPWGRAATTKAMAAAAIDSSARSHLFIR
jgi:hypothetical protein